MPFREILKTTLPIKEYISRDELETDWILVKDKHLRNRYCIAWLELHDIPYSVTNMGSHVQCEINETKVDIWPTTNKIRIDKDNLATTYHGMPDLIAILHLLVSLPTGEQDA